MTYLSNVELATQQLRQRVPGTALMPVNQNAGWVWPHFNPRLGASYYTRNALVRACIDRKATSATEAKLVIKESMMDEGMMMDEEVKTGPLAYLIKNPCYDISMSQWLRMFITYLEIAGNVYVYRRRNGGPRSRLAEWRLLRPDRVTLRQAASGSLYWNYEVLGEDYHIPYTEIRHFIHAPDPLHDIYGLSPLAGLIREVSVDSAATDYTRAFIDNAAVPAGFLSINGELSGGADEAQMIARRWSESAGGMNRGNLLVVEGDAKYEQASPLASPEMPDLRALTETRICMAFSVPPLLVQTRTALATSSGRAEVQQARRSFWEETMTPLYIEIGDFLTSLARMDFGDQYRLEFDLSGVKALQENQDLKDKRVRGQWNDWMIHLDVALDALGYESGEGDHIRKYEIIPAQARMQADAQERAREERSMANEENPNSRNGSNNQSLLDRAITLTREMAVLDGEVALESVLAKAARRIDGHIGGAMASGVGRISTYSIEKDVADAIGNIMWRLAVDVWERVNSVRSLGSIPTDPDEIQHVMVNMRDVTRQWDKDVRDEIEKCGGDFTSVKDIVKAQYREGARSLADRCAEEVVRLALDARYRAKESTGETTESHATLKSEEGIHA